MEGSLPRWEEYVEFGVFELPDRSPERTGVRELGFQSELGADRGQGARRGGYARELGFGRRTTGRGGQRRWRRGVEDRARARVRGKRVGWDRARPVRALAILLTTAGKHGRRFASGT